MHADDAAGTTARRVVVTLCGELRVEVGGRRVDGHIHGRHVRLLIVYLALNRDRPVTRAELIDHLWGEDDAPAVPRAALSVHLTRARQALGAGVIEDRPHHALGLPATAEVDLDRALQAAKHAQAELERGAYSEAIALARAAVAVLEHPMLPGEEADWVQVHRRHLDEQCARALETLATAALALGEPQRATAEGAARQLVAREPTREIGYMLLMRCQAAAGNLSEAVKTYARLRTLLMEELAMPPSAQVRELADRLLRGEQPDARAAGGTAGEAPPSALRRRDSATLYGREPELARLTGWWRGPQPGVRVCLLDGDPGVGKTRLAAELAQQVHRGGACVLYGRSDELPGPADIEPDGEERTSLVPYQPIVESVRQLLALGAMRRPRPELAAELRELARLVPELRAAGHIPSDQPAADPQLRRYQLFQAVAGLLADVADQRGVLLVLDDFHCADEPTAALLRHLLRVETSGRLAVLVLARTPEHTKVKHVALALESAERQCPSERLTLTGLDAGAVARLVRTVAAQAAIPSFVEALVEHTDGNPLFVEEVMLELEASKLLDDRVPDAADLAQVSVPRRVQAVLSRRLERLDAGADAVLGDAAALGLEFGLPVLEELAGPGSDPLTAIELALESGLVVERALPGRFAFTHAMVRDAVYARRSRARRARTHARIARLLAARPDLGANSAELALHWSEAGEWRPAVEAFLAAARAAADVGAFAESLRHYEHALRHFDATGEAPIVEADIAEAAAEVARWSGQPRTAVELLNRALGVLTQVDCDDPGARQMRLHERLGRYWWEEAAWDESLAAYAEALRLQQGRPASVESARVLAGQAAVLMFQERFEESLEYATQALTVARAVGARREEGHALNTHGVDLALTGRFAEGRDELYQALAIAEEVRSLEDQCRAYCNLSELFTRAGQTLQAAEIGEAGYAFARRHGLARSAAPIVAANAVAALALLGCWERAEQLAEESLAEGLAAGDCAYLQIICGELWVLRGEPARARVELAKAQKIVTASFELAMRVSLHVALAELALLEGDHAGARAWITEGLAEADECAENGELTLRLCVAGLRIGAAGEAHEWRAGLADRADRLSRELSGGSTVLPVAAAYVAAVRAEVQEVSGQPAGDAWGLAAEAFAAAGHVYASGQARLAQAEALFADGRRAEARVALAETNEIATALGARVLSDKARRVAEMQRSLAPAATPRSPAH